MTRVCLKVRPAGLSRSLHRVAAALAKHAPPWATVVPRDSDADVVVHHMIGLTGWAEQLARDTAAGRRYVAIQYCLRTTEDPRPEAWLPIWRGAALVWSYYDLEAWAGASDFHSLISPLGVDGDVFIPYNVPRQYRIGTSGYVAETEGVQEAYDACVRTGGRQFHLGPIDLGPAMSFAMGVTDPELAQQWSACDYVAGLRRGEGFELPALEGLACGARAVCFDAPHYRRWYGEHADYIPEGGADAVTDALASLFTGPTRRVTQAERDHVVDVFSWPRIAGAFWDALEEGLARA
jgi:glycosyltransferase involved in cell wall biosynthesis